MTRFFQRLNRSTRGMGEGPREYLRTHPPTTNRTAEARSRADSFTARTPRDGEEFHFVQARLRALMVEPFAAQHWFRTRLDGSSDRPEAALRYGLALSLIQSRRREEARLQTEWLRAPESHSQLYQLPETERL